MAVEVPVERVPTRHFSMKPFFNHHSQTRVNTGTFQVGYQQNKIAKGQKTSTVLIELD